MRQKPGSGCTYSPAKTNRSPKQVKLPKSFTFTPRNPPRESLCRFPFSDGRTCETDGGSADGADADSAGKSSEASA